MIAQALGTLVGTGADGRQRTVTVTEHNGRLELVGDDLDRREIAAEPNATMRQVADLAAKAFAIGGATFIPAHGATGGKGAHERLPG